MRYGITRYMCVFILQMEVLNKFVQQLKFSDDSNFKSTGESLESIVSENVSTGTIIVTSGKCLFSD